MAAIIAHPDRSATTSPCASVAGTIVLLSARTFRSRGIRCPRSSPTRARPPTTRGPSRHRRPAAVAARPPRGLAGDPRDRQPAGERPDGRRREVARDHPGGRLPDDDLVGADRRPARGRRRAGRRRPRRSTIGLLALAVVGLVLAHAANNMINDYFDLTGGIDTDDYVRALYAPHPILSGWVTRAQLRNAILLVNLACAAIMLGLAVVRGPLIIVFALGGLFVSVFYVAPPIRLKYHGLGEPGVFLVWGPLMVGGTFLAASGTVGLVGPARLGAVRPDRDRGPVRQAHRQDRGRREARRPDAAGDPRRGTCATGGQRPDDRLLPADARGRRGRPRRAVGRCWSSSGSRGSSRSSGCSPSRSLPGRRPAIRSAAGRCGSSGTRSSTPAGPAGCSPWACSSTRSLPVTLPWL